MSNFLDDPIDQELEERKSVEAFLMQTIYPSLSQEKKDTIDLHMGRGVSVHGAFEFAGVNYSVCKR
jgi:hypothetical protein